MLFNPISRGARVGTTIYLSKAEMEMLKEEGKVIAQILNKNSLTMTEIIRIRLFLIKELTTLKEIKDG